MKDEEPVHVSVIEEALAGAAERPVGRDPDEGGGPLSPPPPQPARTRRARKKAPISEANGDDWFCLRIHSWTGPAPGFGSPA